MAAVGAMLRGDGALRNPNVRSLRLCGKFQVKFPNS